jgi:hypothetical protein
MSKNINIDRCALAATQRDGEMVGPEPHQPLAEWRRGDQRIGQFRGRILAEHRAAARLAWRRLVPAVFTQRRKAGCGGGLLGESRRVRTVQLSAQPGARIGGKRLGGAAPETEARESVGDRQVHDAETRREPCVLQ